MINDQELLFVVDENNNPLPPLPRSEVHSKGLWHRVAHIWIVNPGKEILCQKRSLSKDISPGKWEAWVGGHMGPNSTDVECAITELEEEIGLKTTPEELHYFKTYKQELITEVQAIFIYKWEGKAKELSVEKEEIDELKWIPMEEVRKAILDESSNWSKSGYEMDMFEWIDKNL